MSRPEEKTDVSSNVKDAVCYSQFCTDEHCVDSPDGNSKYSNFDRYLMFEAPARPKGNVICDNND